MLGIPFSIFTDCNALRSILVKRDLIPRIAPWWLQLQEYDFCIECRPGARMSHEDALSRGPVDDPVMETHILDVLSLESSDRDLIATVQDADEEVLRIKDILYDDSADKIMDVHNNYQLKNGRVYRIVGDSIRWLVPKFPRGFAGKYLKGTRTILVITVLTKRCTADPTTLLGPQNATFYFKKIRPVLPRMCSP